MTRGEDKSQDLVDYVYEEVVDYVCDPGMLFSRDLNVAGLAKKLGVSRTPVSMALTRLECDGLVHKLAGGGWVTAKPTVEDLDELFELREVLDPLLVRKAAQSVDSATAERLLQAVEGMESACEANDLDQWLAADRHFHECLFDLAGNERLVRLQAQLRNQLVSVVAGNVLFGNQMEISCQDHRNLAEAISVGDGELAVKHALDHIVRLKESLVRMLERILGPFSGSRLDEFGSGRPDR